MKKISEGPKLTFSQLMKEVEKIKGSSKLNRFFITEEQIKFLRKCLEKKPPLSKNQAAKLWNNVDGWEPRSPSTIFDYLKRIKEGRL